MNSPFAGRSMQGQAGAGELPPDDSLAEDWGGAPWDLCGT